MKRLDTKLAVTILGSLTATSIVTGILVIQNQRAIIIRDRDQEGQSLANTIAAMSVEGMLGEDYEWIKSNISTAAQSHKQVVYIRIFDETGILKTAYPPEIAVRNAPKRTSTFESPILVAVDDLPSENRGKVEVAINDDRLDQITRSSIWRLSAGTVLTFASLAIVLWFLIRRDVLGPVSVLDRHVARIARGDLSEAVRLERQDELGRLASALEAMRLNLQESYARIEAQVAALQDLDRLKDEFLANTSHELKTPLNGILGLSESLLMGSYGQLEKDSQEAIELISSCANRLWKMTESILQFSRLHSENPEEGSDLECQDLADHLEDALADLRATAEKSGIGLLISIPKDTRVTYRRSELEQIIRILVDNAVKYTEKGLVQVIAKTWTGRARGFQIAVRDTGPGIPRELHARIFEPFVQGAHHERRVKGGVGLGLSIAAKLVQRLGGMIVLESDLGQGASFTVLVPEEQPAATGREFMEPWPPLAAEAARHLATAPGPLDVISTRPPADGPEGLYHVLVMDDENVNREVAYQALRDEFRVTRAADGPSGLNVLRTERVDLVLLDVMMPGMSGYDVLEVMRRERLLDKVPVIILSAKTSREAVVKGLEMGAADYLGKPFHRAELRCRIRAQLEIKQQRRQLLAEVAAKSNALKLAEHASHVKTQFLANMSHEVRTPLNGLLGFLELAREMASNPEQKEYLEIVNERARFLLGILEDVLSIAKIESKAVPLDLAYSNVGDILKSVERLWLGPAQRKNLKLEVVWDAAVELPLWTDAYKLEQILNNLLSNAVKFTRAGGIRVEASACEAETGHVDLCVRVRDSGIGIPRALQETIFHPFTQVDSSTTRDFGGTGLGLSISRSLAYMLGGDLTVASEPGRGSLFTLRIVASRQAPAGAREPSPVAASAPA